MTPVTLEDIRLLEFDKIIDARGNLSYFENHKQIPFVIKRVEYCYDIPSGEGFSGYACENAHELIVALSGSFDIIIHNGLERTLITLNRSYQGLYVPKQIWRQIKNFSTNSLALIVSDVLYKDTNFIYNFRSFINFKNE
jgi:hypothetical protein